MRDQKGEKNNRAKLTWDQVREIRRRWMKENVTQVQLSIEYDVSTSAISNIISRKSWAEDVAPVRII